MNHHCPLLHLLIEITRVLILYRDNRVSVTLPTQAKMYCYCLKYIDKVYASTLFFYESIYLQESTVQYLSFSSLAHVKLKVYIKYSEV